jgi:hypothetical protein
MFSSSKKSPLGSFIKYHKLSFGHAKDSCRHSTWQIGQQRKAERVNEQSKKNYAIAKPARETKEP